MPSLRPFSSDHASVLSKSRWSGARRTGHRPDSRSTLRHLWCPGLPVYVRIFAVRGYSLTITTGARPAWSSRDGAGQRLRPPAGEVSLNDPSPRLSPYSSPAVTLPTPNSPTRNAERVEIPEPPPERSRDTLPRVRVPSHSAVTRWRTEAVCWSGYAVTGPD